MNNSTSYRAALAIIKSQRFSMLLVIILFCTLFYYFGELVDFARWEALRWSFPYTNRDFLQYIFLAPIIYAGYVFGLRWSVSMTLVSFIITLPGVLSPSASSSLILRSVAFTAFAGTIGLLIGIIRENARKNASLNEQQQAVARQLRISEERYRQLFENAYDAIWINNMDGNIIAANDAARKFNGFKVEDLSHTSVNPILSDDSLRLANEIRTKLLRGEPVIQPYEQKLITKDKKEVILKLTTTLASINGRPIGFQHIAMDITEQKRLEENQRFYSQLIMKILEEERARISHELYEEVIQTLSAHMRQLDALDSASQGLPEKNRNLPEAMLKQTENVIQELRRLGSGLRPPILDRLGLLSAIQSLASDTTERSGIVITVEVFGNEQRLSKDTELLFYRVIEEALKNTSRHSDATRAKITIEYDENKTRVTTIDNGKGSSRPKIISDLVREGKLGWASMQERVTSAGGKLIIESQIGKGTSISVELPK